jgi:hypothetical protein
MAFKRLIVLGGAALLIAGCGTDSPTTPVGQVNGVESSSRTAKQSAQPRMAPVSLQSADSASCRSWPIVTGVVGDSTCAAP